MPHDLLISPRWKSEHLGQPMPDNLHALSACLPTWADNVGYEEGDPAVIDKLQSAYPRFCFHPLVNDLCARFLNSDQRRGLPFASESSADRAVEYLVSHGVEQIEIFEVPGLGRCGVTVLENDFTTLKQYWQHAGEIASSRIAQQCLTNGQVSFSDTDARQTVRRRVAAIHDTDVENVFLYPSGMAAVAASWRLATTVKPDAPTCQFGFPYVDTLKIQERFPGANHWFLPIGDQVQLQDLSLRCSTTSPAAIFCEVPTNPLLRVPDISGLRTVADTADSLLIIDDTLTACGNMQTLKLSDITVTSLTKYFSGYGDVLAGALVLNPAGRNYQTLRTLLESTFEEMLSDNDVAALEKNSRDYADRMVKINSNATELADRLSAHESVADVFYPSRDESHDRSKDLWTGRGYGGLLSVVLHDAERTTPAAFDALEVCKGPNLGTNFTLCCPYTILAHYNELDFAESCGVSRWLLRISVGTEPIDDLWTRFETALHAGRTSG